MILNKYISKYIDEGNEPLYPFGFGLSYTTFTYGDVQLGAAAIGSVDNLTVTTKVTNTGTRQGEEVVQLYIRDLVGSVTRPVKELKGFQKISLQAGESKEVIFTLTPDDLKFYRMDMTFGSEPGKFEVYVGTNSRDVKQAAFVLK